MNKSQLIDTIADRLELGRRQAVETVEAVFETIQQAVVNGERVVISGFGVFEKVQRAARLGRNPATGEPVPVQETVVPKFRPGTEFKAYVSGAKDMAQTAVQTARERVERTVQAAADQINWPGAEGGEGAEHPDGAGGTGPAAATAKPAPAPQATTRAPGKSTRSAASKTGATRSGTRTSGTATRRTAATGDKPAARRTSTGGTAKPASARATGTRAAGSRSAGAAKKKDSAGSNDGQPDGAPGVSKDGSSSSG